MNINDFQNLSNDEALAQAGAIAGVEPKVFDGLWRTESGRGANQYNAKSGAEGHFQLMPSTRKTMEGRFGTTIDPYDFKQSLFTAAHLIKENLGRFKNVPDALRAYNGGWNPATWTNPETATYAGKVLGDTSADGRYGDIQANASTAAAVATGAATAFSMSAADAFVAVGQPKSGTPNAAFPKTAAANAAAALAARTETNSPDLGTGAYRSNTEQAAQQAKRVQHEIDNQSVGDVLIAAADSSLVVNGVKWAARDRYEPDPNFAVKESQLDGYDDSEINQLLDAKSQKEFDRIKFDLDDHKEQSRLTNLQGTWWGFGASIIADLPGAVLTGGTATVGAKALGFGSLALAAQGRKAAALAANLGENVVGNIGATAALDASGYNQGSADYALGAVASVLGPALGARYIGSIASEAAEHQAAVRIAHAAVEKQVKLSERAVANLGANATPDQLRMEIERLDAQAVKQDLDSHRSSIPNDRKIVTEDLLDEHGMPKVQEHDAEAKASSKANESEAANDPLVNEDGSPKPQTPHEAAAADAEVGTNGKPLSSSKQTPAWEKPSFHADREWQFQNNPEWIAGAERVSNGVVKGGDWSGIQGIRVLPEVLADVTLKRQALAVAELAEKYGIKNLLITPTTQGIKGESGVIMTLGDKHIIGLQGGLTPGPAQHAAFHELGHAIYQQFAKDAPAELMNRIAADHRAFVKAAKARDPSAWQSRWAVTSPNRSAAAVTDYTLNRSEWMAEQYVKHLQNAAMGGQLAGKVTPGVIKQITDAVEALWNYVADLVRTGHLKSNKAADEFFQQALEGGFGRVKKGEQFLAPELRLPELSDMAASDKALPTSLQKEVQDFLDDPVAIKANLVNMPMATPQQRAEAKVVLSVWKKALDPAAAWNNINESRLNKLLASAPDAWGLNPTSNAMLKSDNPVARMLAVELLENGGGAGGRRSTASIAKYMNERKIEGNTVNEVQSQYKVWRQANGGSVGKDFLDGDHWRRFNRQVAEEIEGRRAGTPSTAPDSVKAAADSMEGAFERARLMQVDSKTIGWGALPENSRGYMPHRMSSGTVRNLSTSQREAFTTALTDQFVTTAGFDAEFAQGLSKKYMDLVQRKALGGFEAPAGIHSTGAADVVKEALEQMDLTQPQINAMMKKYVAGGAGHTKKRLDIDLTRPYTNDDGTQFSLMDLFETDQLKLLRSQSQRVSGEVALARHGIMGKPGLALARRAMEFGGDGNRTQGKVFEAYDQVAAEFLGSPFGTQNKWVDRALQANSLSSLGGMGFNQLGEMINMAMTLGVKSTMANVAGMPRLWKEVHALAKGQKVENGWLDTVELFGGAQFGADNHKMIFPFDQPDLPLNSMGKDSVTALDRALRGGVHLQGTLSGWRALHGVQVRGAAEQIVQKSLRYIREGIESKALLDMGFTKDMQEALKKDMQKITKWKDGRMVGLDITAVSDPAVANAYVQAVHRGANQIIQGSFIGESGKYVHSSWGRLMTQFRSFGLTAIDKQWARQKGNYGTATALLMTLAAMSAASPIYMARTYLAAMGREDKDAYLEKQLHPTQIGRASMNYIATSGLAGDFLDAMTAATGVGQVTGGRSGAQSDFVGNVIAPAAGKVDKVWGGVQKVFKEGDVHGLLKEAPLARLPWLIPAVNTLGR